MSRAPWRTGPRLQPCEREQIREAAEARRAQVGTLDAACVRGLRLRFGVSRATVYNLAGPPADKGGDDDR
jgi:hypothetical protein